MTMSSQQRSMTIALWAVLILVMAGVIVAGVWNHFHDGGRDDLRAAGEPTGATPLSSPRMLSNLWPAPAFAVISQDGQPFSSDDLRGHVYIANFIFTSCAGPCPMMSARMADLQKKIPDPAIRFVSFSVDPERDTPAVLNAYARQFNADPARWIFLTGKPEAMFAIAQGMKMADVKQPDMSVMHSTFFLLVDSTGAVRGTYHTEGADADQQMSQLVKDVATLSLEKGRVRAAGPASVPVSHPATTGDRPS